MFVIPHARVKFHYRFFSSKKNAIFLLAYIEETENGVVAVGTNMLQMSNERIEKIKGLMIEEVGVPGKMGKCSAACEYIHGGVGACTCTKNRLPHRWKTQCFMLFDKKYKK